MDLERKTQRPMSNIIAIWNNLTAVKRAMLIGVVSATLAVFALLIFVASSPKMAFLYGGLDPAAAGDVLSALEAMDVQADVRGDAIYVPITRRDSVRMALARQGLPQQGQPGFELLDQMNGFATTSEMFDAAYWRAKEGELARTILSTPGVKSARIHLSVPPSSSFARNRRAPRASVTIAMKRGRLGLQHATAMRYLVALAVPDLEPEQVAIMDSIHGVILKPGKLEPGLESIGDEADKIRRLEQSLVDLIEARVGPGNARVTVSLSIDRERETVSERILDPDSRIVMDRETTDTQKSNIGNGGGAVTVASNLPEGEIGAAESSSRSQSTESKETARFAVSEVNRQREKLPGAIARMNVAVLVNEPVAIGAINANAPAPRTQEELDNIRDLVIAAVGYDEARGDVVTVRALTFHTNKPAEDLSEKSGVLRYVEKNLFSILQIVIPALVVLLLAMFVVRPVLMQETSPAVDNAPVAELAPLSQEISKPEQKSPIDEMRALASSKQGETTTVLKTWLGETEEAA